MTMPQSTGALSSYFGGIMEKERNMVFGAPWNIGIPIILSAITFLCLLIWLQTLWYYSSLLSFFSFRIKIPPS